MLNAIVPMVIFTAGENTVVTILRGWLRVGGCLESIDVAGGFYAGMGPTCSLPPGKLAMLATFENISWAKVNSIAAWLSGPQTNVISNGRRKMS